jgi:hypothetical protein
MEACVSIALPVSKSKQAAPENWRRMTASGSVFEHRFYGVHTVIGAKVATRCRDTAVENELSIGVVEQRFSRCGYSESPQFPAVLIFDNEYTGDRGGVIPQITPCPALTHRSRGVNQHVSIELDAGVGHNQCQFSNGGARTRTLWMGEHEQRRLARYRSKASTVRPIRGRRRQTSRSIRVPQQNSDSHADGWNPQDYGGYDSRFSLQPAQR